MTSLASRRVLWGAAAVLTGALAVGVRLVPFSMTAQSAVTINFTNGRVSLKVENATVGEVLAEWSRQGGTRVENAQALPAERISLELYDVHERQALEAVLRAVPGYVLTARPETAAPGPRSSGFASIVIGPSSGQRSTAASAKATPAPPAWPEGLESIQGDEARLPPNASAPASETNAEEGETITGDTVRQAPDEQ